MGGPPGKVVNDFTSGFILFASALFNGPQCFHWRGDHKDIAVDKSPNRYLLRFTFAFNGCHSPFTLTEVYLFMA